MKTVLLAAILLGGMLAGCTNKEQTKTEEDMLTLNQEWDKVFPLSEKVNHRKVTFETQYGLTLAADLYTPKESKGKLAAIAVSGPFGAVKEQSSAWSQPPVLPSWTRKATCCRLPIRRSIPSMRSRMS